MTERDWAEAPYARVYATLPTDPKTAPMWKNDRLLAAYVRLLLAADLSWPMPPAVPRWVADDVLEALVAARIIELSGDTYQVVGLRAERTGRKSGRAAGGHARAASARRDEDGRFVAGVDAGNGGDAGALLDALVDQQMLDSSNPARRDETRQAKTRTTRAIARNGSGGAAATRRYLDSIEAIKSPDGDFAAQGVARP